MTLDEQFKLPPLPALPALSNEPSAGDKRQLECWATAAVLADREDRPPIDMVLYCPACGTQHIDKPEGQFYPGMTAEESAVQNAAYGAWTNPPHRSHLCHGCGHIWRPADVPTNGVAALQTKGKNDSPFRPSPMSQPNRLIAYSACDMLRASGYSWNDKLKVWTK